VPRLLDGSEGGPLPDALDRLRGQAVVARLRVRSARRLDASARRCLTTFEDEFRLRAATPVVERVGVLGVTLTFADADRRTVLGCDRTSPGRAGPWCARSAGRLRSGRLSDPRVDILCRDRSGHAVGFGWIAPDPATRWLGVDTGSGLEIDSVGGSLPVRIATLDVDGATSSASFAVTEYDEDGEEVRRYRLEAPVAG